MGSGSLFGDQEASRIPGTTTGTYDAQLEHLFDVVDDNLSVCLWKSKLFVKNWHLFGVLEDDLMFVGLRPAQVEGVSSKGLMVLQDKLPELPRMFLVGHLANVQVFHEVLLFLFADLGQRGHV